MIRSVLGLSALLASWAYLGGGFAVLVGLLGLAASLTVSSVLLELWRFRRQLRVLENSLRDKKQSNQYLTSGYSSALQAACALMLIEDCAKSLDSTKLQCLLKDGSGRSIQKTECG